MVTQRALGFYIELTKKIESYTELFKSLDKIEQYCLRIWEDNHFQWFTNHDIKHSQEIIHLLGQLLEPIENTQEFLTKHELFILLASAYLHDIGMQYLKVDNISIDKLTSNEYDQIRKGHAERSHDIILKGVAKSLDRDDFHLPHIYEEYIPIIAKVCKGHSTDCFDEVVKDFQENPCYAKNRRIRGEFLTALLMIGDELDLQGKRIDFTKISQFTLSGYSLIHWYKHHYVEYIAIEKGIIHLRLKFPQNSDDYQLLIKEWIEKKLKEQIAKVKQIFPYNTDGKLHLPEDFDTKIIIDKTTTTRELPKEALQELRRILKKNGQIVISGLDSIHPLRVFPKASSPLFTGRKNELKRFEEALYSSSFVSIEGLGGIGKTEFAAKCIEEFIPKEKAVWFDCMEDSKLDALIDCAGYADVIKGENKTELAKYSGFTDLFERDGKIIFLEDYQKIIDKSFLKFFKFSERRLKNAKIVLISREHPSIGGVRVFPVNLSGFADDALEYAKKIISHFYPDVTVSDNNLKSICNKLDGHPLAIEFALQLLSYGEPPEDILYKIIKIKEKNEELANRLLDEVFNHPKSTNEEKSFMMNFSVFRGKVERRAIDYVFDFKDSTLYTLMDKHMITYTPSDGLYGTHPLIREFCYDRTKNKKDLHEKASEYFKTRRKERFDPLLEEEICYHLLQADNLKGLADLISEKGRAFILLGHTNSLKEKIEISISKGIERPEFFVFCGDIAQIRGEWEEASQFFERAFSFPNSGEKVNAEAFIKYGEMLFRKGRVKEALSYFEDSCSICKKIKCNELEAWSLNDIGLVYNVFGNLAVAETKLYEALNKYEQDKVGITNTLINIGIVLHAKGDLIGALERYNESLEIKKEIGDKVGIAASLNNISNVLHDKGDLRGALKRYNESLEISKEIGDKQGIATSLNNIGIVLHAKGDLIGALKKAYEGLEISKEIGDKQGIAASLDNIGIVLHAIGDLREALKRYNESLEIRKEIGDKQGIAANYNNIGGVYKDKRDYCNSIVNFLKSYALQTQMGIKKEITLKFILKIRKILKFANFKALIEDAVNNLPEDLKPFVDFNDFLTVQPIQQKNQKHIRNEPCPCGRGKKYKKCCGK